MNKEKINYLEKTLPIAILTIFVYVGILFKDLFPYFIITGMFGSILFVVVFDVWREKVREKIESES